MTPEPSPIWVSWRVVAVAEKEFEPWIAGVRVRVEVLLAVMLTTAGEARLAAAA